MIFAIYFEKCIADIDIYGIIIGKLCYKKKLCLIILLKVDKNLKVSFYCTILSLSLTICLWVKSSKKFPLKVKEIT